VSDHSQSSYLQLPKHSIIGAQQKASRALQIHRQAARRKQRDGSRERQIESGKAERCKTERQAEGDKQSEASRNQASREKR
jgi:hypothetical protein